MALAVTGGIALPDDDLVYRAVRSGGPGGQHVNKVATKIELRFHMGQCAALSGAVKVRFAKRFPGVLTTDGDVVVTSARFRSQARNRCDVEERLVVMIREVLEPPAPRHPTRVPGRTKVRRLADKRQRGEAKERRRPPRPDEE
jgi:ribosome-associated protein